tara:strand:+ start:617 stop:811 length:195 start_codon:yes stop_codon:yes gene_type:complete
MIINIQHKIHHQTAIKALEEYLGKGPGIRRIVLRDLARHGFYTSDTFLDAYELSARPKTVEDED